MTADSMPMIRPDYLEAGSSGPVVVLLHSSVAGARQWRRLMDDLRSEFRVIAVNLFGYGGTAAWPPGNVQTLDDQARLVEGAIPLDAEEVHIVGHSFGGAVAMRLAARLAERTGKLILFEPIPFHLLREAGRTEALVEVLTLRDWVRTYGVLGEWESAAERFADYWNGGGSWQRMTLERRKAFAAALRPNYCEWDAVMNDGTPLEEWARILPRSTLLMMDRETVRPVRAVTALLRRACPWWRYLEVSAGGHMAPLTNPCFVNPLIRSFLRQRLDASRRQPALAGSRP